MVDTSFDLIQKMLFISFRIRKIIFLNCWFILKSITAIDILLNTYWIDIINKKEFVKLILDKNIKIFIV